MWAWGLNPRASALVALCLKIVKQKSLGMLNLQTSQTEMKQKIGLSDLAEPQIHQKRSELVDGAGRDSVSSASSGCSAVSVLTVSILLEE